MKEEFIEGTTFKGIWYPRFDSQPNGPKTQSFSRCECGELWNKHRCHDGACPVQPAKEGEAK
jgi:hypothetical protein